MPQRFHRGRAGRIVSPGVAGFLATVDPHQAGKAVRELQLLLSQFEGLVPPDYLRSHTSKSTTAPSEESGTTADRKRPRDDPEEGSESGSGSEEENDDRRPQLQQVNRNNGGGGGSSLSDLLALELAGVSAPPKGGEHHRRVADSDSSRGHQSSQWFRSLETNCKGYVFLNAPFAPKEEEEEEGTVEVEGQGTVSQDRETAGVNPDIDSNSKEEGATTASATTTASSAVLPVAVAAAVHPYVSVVAEGLLEDLVANPRPAVRFTHRLIPVVASCCPTAPSITATVTAIFRETSILESLDATQGKRFLIKVGVSLAIKNNTTAEKQKKALRDALENSIPKNRCVVLPAGRKDIVVDMVVVAVVLHSTCCIGLQRAPNTRHDYNLHSFGKGLLTLDDRVSAPPTIAVDAVPSTE